MKSPTTRLKLRGNDPKGHGYYGASRGIRKHKGTDYVAEPGEAIFACVSGKVRIGNVYATSSKMKLVEITGDEFRIKQMYVYPYVKNGAFVKAGQFIGVAQDIAGYHKSTMINHVHVSVWKNGLLTDPEPLIKQ